ncbi:MAG TPA: carboxypeptidase-like regulatory domain-containing protein [Solirubrobacterales bacterium]|nr:carboxypeptidase-like regulatory domain-containing protein [Solirubrobacterales bacterium]
MRQRRWVLPIALLALLGAALAHAAPARASQARFTYELCDSALPGGDPPAIEFYSAAAYAPFQTCAEPGGAVGVKPTAYVGQSEGTITVEVEATPGGFVESETITAFASNMQSGNGLSHVAVANWPPQDNLDTTRYFLLRTAPPGCSQCVVGGAFPVNMTCGEGCQPTGIIGAHYIAATEVDPIPPEIGKVTGPLLSGGVLRGHQAISATATDVGGGVSALEVMVNGNVAPGTVSGTCAAAPVANPSYHGLAAYSPTPCPPALAGNWNLDTGEPPFHEGANSVQVCASDFATFGEPNRTCSSPQTVAVDNSCTESPVGGGANLAAHFTKSKRTKVTVRYGASAKVAGTLTDGNGNPVGGASVCVQSTTEGSAGPPTTVGTATTDPEGRFVYAVPSGPNRTVLIGYRRDSFELTQSMEYRAHVRPTLEAGPKKLHNGEKVRLSGRLPQPGAGGRVVVLQANVPGSKRWITFRKATTGQRGRFKATYHFTSTTRKITYRFRALVPLQAGYPWEQGASKPTSVTVTR